MRSIVGRGRSTEKNLLSPYIIIIIITLLLTLNQTLRSWEEMKWSPTEEALDC